ncbi:hypothetical protein FNV62_21680 [Streptomyces sp. RLB3-17]|nr:hypothetical protein FNV62_21680 [Streptomyces sp. RLB3-17]
MICGYLLSVICQPMSVSGYRSPVSGQRSAVSGQRSAVSGQRTADSGQRSPVSVTPNAVVPAPAPARVAWVDG